MKLLTPLLLMLTSMFSGQLQAKPLKVGVSFAIPPYVIESNQRGIELDLLKEAFAGSGYEPSFEFLPLERTFRLFESGKLDAIINVRPGMVDPHVLTQPVITFHNRIFTLRSTHINTLDDLHSKRVTAFQRARIILGGAFATMANQNPHYEEVAKQQVQVHQLMRGRVDAVVLEERVFYYYLDQLIATSQAGEHYERNQVRQADLFPPTVYHFAFRAADARNLFDKRLEAMRQDGRYHQIFAAYGATP
ncbi:polar amino acid ABC transporter [Aeromonas sp. HMWF036]|uniref:substrate-binding periplasmic protein n=1 Tax=unclassified Aeromonas TaxID=257493 RepID=UPI000D379053|nr:polar amino acid ABC transporter [Aeromonas sp. HMWF036]PTT26944.1 polar amino acid ABC transporter [Aeromonas sp. HMWF017]